MMQNFISYRLQVDWLKRLAQSDLPNAKYIRTITFDRRYCVQKFRLNFQPIGVQEEFFAKKKDPPNINKHSLELKALSSFC